jgi:anti-sigma factor RsiW
MNDRLPEWESQINALLDGELDEASTESLKRAAAQDQELARAIIEAYELQRDMERLGVEAAPKSLRRKLRRIPREQRTTWRPQRWALATAMAAVPLLVIGITLMQPRQPSAAEVEQARQDLALAFSYIEQVGNRTGGVLNDVLATELQHNVTDNISKHIPFTESSQEEKNS